jgi:glucosamine--fructose-6-phosphate aminotransferase (isomerizing)
MAVLNSVVSVFDLKTGKEIKPESTLLNWKIEDARKGKYKHFLHKEISEQPHMLQNVALSYADQAKELAFIIKSAQGTFMLGCGTASYAALAGTYLFSNIAKIHINFTVGSEFEYLEDYLTSKSLLVPISQSGETIDVIDPVVKAKNKKVKIAAIVNVLGSTLYRISDYKFLLGAGPEKAVISTKAFTAMYSMLLLTAYTLADKASEGKELILKASDAITNVLTMQDNIKKTAEKLKKFEHIFIIGRGLSYVAALEASLKIKETSYVHAEGFAGGELKHGVIALIEKGTPCIVIAPNNETYDEIISNAQQIKSRGGFIIGIGPKESQTFDIFLKTDDIKEATFLPQIAIVQLLAYYLALARGIKDPDKPRNLAKSVTVK